MKAAWVIFLDKKTEQVLILKRSELVRNPGQWCFPGGSHKKYKPRRLAIEEAWEEVGLRLSHLKLVLRVSLRIKEHYFYIFYLRSNKAQIKLDKESSKYKWVKIKSLREQKNKHKSIKLFLKNYKDGKKVKPKTKTDIRLRKATKKRSNKSTRVGDRKTKGGKK